MAQIVECPSCRKQYAFKALLAGKRVKCKCGGRIQFPNEAPPDMPLELLRHDSRDDSVDMDFAPHDALHAPGASHAPVSTPEQHAPDAPPEPAPIATAVAPAESAAATAAPAPAVEGPAEAPDASAGDFAAAAPHAAPTAPDHPPASDARPALAPRPFGSRRAESSTAMEAPPDMFAPDPTCPNCKKSLPEGSVMCLSCGYNLQTGKMPEAAVAEPAAKPKKKLRLVRLAGILAIIFVLVCGLGIGTLWLFGAKIPGARKLPLVGWFARTRFDQCRFALPADLTSLHYYDVRALRKAPYYQDNKDTLDAKLLFPIAAYLPKDKKPIDTIDRLVIATGPSGSIAYYRFNDDQPKELIFPGGKALSSKLLDNFTEYNLDNRDYAIWIDARELVIGNHQALLSMSSHYNDSNEANQSAEMTEVLETVKEGDLIIATGASSQQSRGSNAEAIEKADGVAISLGGTLKAHSLTFYGSEAAASKNVDFLAKAQQDKDAEPTLKNMHFSLHGKKVEGELSMPYADAKKSLKGIPSVK